MDPLVPQHKQLMLHFFITIFFLGLYFKGWSDLSATLACTQKQQSSANTVTMALPLGECSKIYGLEAEFVNLQYGLWIWIVFILIINSAVRMLSMHF